MATHSVDVSVETLSESQIQEVTLDGHEIYVQYVIIFMNYYKTTLQIKQALLNMHITFNMLYYRPLS